MRHSQAPRTRACGLDKLLETLEDQETAQELRLLLCLKRNKMTCSLLRLDFRPVRTHFDLVARPVSARHNNRNPAVVMSFHRSTGTAMVKSAKTESQVSCRA